MGYKHSPKSYPQFYIYFLLVKNMLILKVDDLKQLKEMEKEIKKERIPCFLVRDAGLTQLKPGTVTALGIGPVEEKRIDKITGKLKLL